jgi:molybdate transport system substrate-binding protein
MNQGRPVLNFLSAGAAQGLLKALQPAFEAAHGVTLQGRFGAVGAMKEALLAGEPCDLFVSTDTMVGDLAAQGRLDGSTRAALGRVRTGVAVRRGDPRPDVSTPESLRAALRAASGIYFPDPLRATAGIHFAQVLRDLSIHDELLPRFRTFPNGATAMRELAGASEPGLIGCTQVTEILYTAGVDLVAMLPPQFELATVYTAAVTAGSPQAALAQQLVQRMAGDEAAALRRQGGFE